ncbi:MAG: hypothetical protein Q9219_002456 [cf. Caloplaca sp. 3 TL-2023]
MDIDDLLASPRKKHKARHHSKPTMAENPATGSAMEENQPINDSSSKDRLDKETRCGITEYVSPQLPGFQGTLKKRYTDFLVNEIMPNGKVIHLDYVKRPSDQQRLSQPASQTRQQQTKTSGRTSLEAEKSTIFEENVPPRFESTNLNKFDHGVRKHETVYLRHGADTLDLVGGPEETGSAKFEEDMVVNENQKKGPPKAGQPSETHGNNSEEEPAVESIGLDNEASEKLTAPLGSEPVAPKTSNPPASGSSSTVGGWQAYAQTNNAGSDFALSDVDRDLLITYFDTETFDELLAFFQRIVASPLRKARDFGAITTKPLERDARTEAHQAIRRIFSSKLETTTNDAGEMVITAATTSSSRDGKRSVVHGAGNRKQTPKGKLGWAEFGGDYLHFTIYKENRDTMETISHLARILKLKPQLFQFAGTKDRRGVTVQRASVYRVQANRLWDAGRTLRQSKIGNFEYLPQRLQLGDLMGNEFLITLRDCRFQLDGDSGSEIDVERASISLGRVIENFSSHGFVNYFGLQRFGSFSAGTHTIGRSMLQGNFKAACEAILSFHPVALAAAQQRYDQNDSEVTRDDMARASALHAFATTGRSKEALERLPRKFSAEACLIRHLARADNRNDYLGALQTISRNLRLMYVHAYQSLVWNIAASARWKAHGNKVLPGDLVLVNEHPDPSIEQPHPNTSGVDQDGEPIVVAEASDRSYTSDEIFTQARALTESELSSPDCKISTFDIVLPLPGYDILYPTNDSGNIYKEFMSSEEGGGLDPYDMRRKWKDVSLSGSYRKLLARPLGKVEWEIKAYGAKGEDEQFVMTDLEKLERGRTVGKEEKGMRESKPKEVGASVSTSDCDGPAVEADVKAVDTPPVNTLMDQPVAASAPDPSNADSTAATAEPDTSTSTSVKTPADPQNDKLAVILKLQLGSSTYATMALRELMKEGGVKTWKMEGGGGR